MRIFDETNPLVDFKLKLLKRAMPCKSAVVFGDMYMVEGAYTIKCVEYGCKYAMLIDSFETADWLLTRAADPRIDFRKGDFSNTLFMKSITEKCELGIVYDILLHQAPLVNTLHLMLEKITKRICIVQPVLIEQSFEGTLVYLPGNTQKELYPLEASHPEFKMFDVEQVNHANWIWGMTPSFIRNVLRGEGFKVIDEQSLGLLPNPHWTWWGCIAEKTRDNPRHWSHVPVMSTLHDGKWSCGSGNPEFVC